MSDKLPTFGNEYVDTYLDYVENTESPRIYHLMCSLSAIAAAAGRRVSLPWGDSELYPNMFIALVGPPAVKKSTAINTSKKLLRNATNIRFAPDDTAGQRQGLLKSMLNAQEEEDSLFNNKDLSAFEALMQQGAEAVLEKMGETDVKFIDEKDRHILYICASELTSILGTKQNDMLTFLLRMYDCDEYRYQLKNTEMSIDDGLLNILGATTPQALASSLPTEAVGGGFMSRVILVYASKKYKSIPRPRDLDPILRERLQSILLWVNQAEGIIAETKAAEALINELYEEKADIDDVRFVYYIERRQLHLLKISMCLALARMSYTIEVQDIRTARDILKYCETFMPDALGEFGLTKDSMARQRILDFLQHANQPITGTTLYSLMSRDMIQRDFISAMSEMCNSGKILEVQTDFGKAYVYRDTNKETYETLMQDLIESEIKHGSDNIVELKRM